MLAYRLIPPGAGAAAAAALAPALIRRNGGRGPAANPPRLDPLQVVGPSVGFRLVGPGIRGGVLLCQGARRDDDKAQWLQSAPSGAVLDLHVAE